MDRLDTIRIIENHHVPLTVRWQWRFPRSKRVRIRKKWAKRQENFRVYPAFWKVKGVGILAHPEAVAMLKAKPRIEVVPSTFDLNFENLATLSTLTKP